MTDKSPKKLQAGLRMPDGWSIVVLPDAGDVAWECARMGRPDFEKDAVAPMYGLRDADGEPMAVFSPNPYRPYEHPYTLALRKKADAERLTALVGRASMVVATRIISSGSV